MVTKHVRVEESDIKRSRAILSREDSVVYYSQSGNCPVALAMQRAFGEYVAVYGRDFDVYVRNSRQYGQELPLEVRMWIKDYDTHKDVEPIEFDVSIPFEVEGL